jgi:hypothetical protein
MSAWQIYFVILLSPATACADSAPSSRLFNRQIALHPVQVVKAPGNLVISAYVTCPDITLTVTPDLKLPGRGKLLWVDLGGGSQRLGGSALAHAYSQVSLLFCLSRSWSCILNP